jgi:PAS domain S-box-containing protein
MKHNIKNEEKAKGQLINESMRLCQRINELELPENERKRAEQLLRESEERFRTIVNSALDSIFIKDGSCKYQFVNTAMERLFGIPASELSGKSDDELFGKDAGKHISEVDDRVLRGEVVEEEHTKPVRGVLTTFHVIKVPMSDASGKIVGLCGIARDITERKRVEEALRKAHNELEQRVEERTVELATRNKQLELEIAKRKQAEGTIKRRLEFEKTVSTISSRFINYSDFDEAINISLCKTGRLSGADRAYLFVFSQEGAIMDNTHEWCAEGVSPEIDNLKNLPSDMFPWWMRKLQKGEVIHIKDVSKMPSEAKTEKEILENQNIKSLLVLPVHVKGEVAGFMGFDNVRETGGWTDDDLTILRISSELIGNALERKRAEELLRIKDWAIESSINAISLADLEGNLTHVNTSFLKLWGYKDKNEIFKKPAVEFWQTKEKASEGLEALHDKGSWIGELVAKRKDGSLFDVQLSASMVKDEAGNPICMMASFVDITQRKQAEEELKRITDELKRSNADLQQFAYAASHDLMEPLRGVEGFVKLLAGRYKDKLDANADDFIGHTVEEVKRMQVLIKDLLEYSQVGTKGKRFKPIDSSLIVGLAVGNLQVAIEENGAVVTYDNLPTIKGDFSQLSRLFQNLIGNAIKFRSEKTPRIHVSAERKENEWVFSVRDNGTGIDPGNAERIFIVFQRLHSKDEYPGTGIGLAICKKIVERHGGRIWLESETGKGSTFYFTIPVAK